MKKGGESLKRKGVFYNYGVEGHFASECTKPKENKAFVGRAWSDNEDRNELQNDATCLLVIDSQEVCLKYDLLLDDWILDSGFTKYMTENIRLFTSYKVYDGRHVVFRRNLNGKVVGGGVFLGYSQTSKAYIVPNKETMRIDGSFNVTFDESLPEPKSSFSVKDDRIDKPIVQDLNGSLSLQVDALDEGYPKSLKEARGHLINQVISELNERTLRDEKNPYSMKTYSQNRFDWRIFELTGARDGDRKSLKYVIEDGDADNRPPMLEKYMYDSWKSRMELYMLNRQHGRMILESVEHAEAIQADCDVKATNIILQGIPLEERECKLYDEFDKFAYRKGETLQDFYLRFSLLLNDMNMYNMKLEQFHVNTKFLNTLPPEWNNNPLFILKASIRPKRKLDLTTGIHFLGTMETTIEQQVALDEALVPSAQRLRIERSNFRLLSDIQSKELTLKLVYDVLRKCPFYKRNVDYAFLIWEDFVYQVEYKNQKNSNEMYYPRFTKVIIHHFMSKDLSIPRRNKVNWHYVRDDFMFSMIKLVSRHQTTQQFGAMLPTELTNEEIRNSKAYKEYYAIVAGEAAPKPKASVRRTRGDSDTSITPPTAIATPRPTAATTPRLTATAKGKQIYKAPKAKNLSAPSEVARTEAQQMKIVLKRSRQQMLISQPGGSGTDEGTGSKPKVPDVPTDESEEELSWNSSDDEGADDQEKVGDDDKGDEGNDRKEEEDDDDEEDKDGNERDDDDDEDQEVTKSDNQDDAEGSEDDDEVGESDEEVDDEETRVEESFDHIPRTPKSSEDEGDGEENQGLNVNEEEEHVEEEEEDELYRDVNINQGRGLQVTQEVKDSHVTLTLINSDGQQESSSVSSQFVTNMLNPTSDAGMESIFATASTFVAPLILTAPTMIPSTVTTITTTSQAPIPPTPISSEVLQNLTTFASVFCFDDRLRSLEQNFSERMNEAVKVVVQLQSDWLRKEAQKENDEFLRTIDENIKKIIKEKVKEQVKAQAFVNAYESDKIILDTYGETITLKRRHDDDEDKDEEPSAGPDRGSKRRREGKEPESASTPSKTATKSVGRSTTGSRSRQASAIESAFVEEPVQTTSQMEEPSHLEFEIGADDQPIIQSSEHPKWFSQLQKPPTSDRDWNKTLSALRVDTLTLEILAGPTYELMKGSCKSLIELEYHLEEVYKATTDKLDWVNPEGQQRIITATKLKIVEWHSYKYLDWITDKKNILMRIDELHKFSDGTLNDVLTALDDRLKGIRMRYLPQTIWRKSDKDRAAAMIQAIDKMLKTRRAMRSLERFVGGSLYEGDFRMLQRTI
nr:hypothetical protein [Tanacetum cinerariifolium]